jgi:hypothetical protein
MTAPSPAKGQGSGFGSNAVGSAAQDCPLGNLNFEVLERPGNKPPSCAVRLFIDGPRTLEGGLAAGFKQGGFLHIDPGPYTVGILPDDDFIDRYEVPSQQQVTVPKSKTASVTFLIDPLAQVEVQVSRADGERVGGEVQVVLTRPPDKVGRERTTEGGKARFEQVRAGTYSVSVKLPPELEKKYAVPAPVSVTVQAGTTPPPVQVQLVPLPWIVLRVAVEGASTVKSFSAKARGPGGTPVSGAAPDESGLRFDGLEVGEGACAVDEVTVPDGVWEFVSVSST